jgi:hypothetical protein
MPPGFQDAMRVSPLAVGAPGPDPAGQPPDQSPVGRGFAVRSVRRAREGSRGDDAVAADADIRRMIGPGPATTVQCLPHDRVSAQPRSRYRPGCLLLNALVLALGGPNANLHSLRISARARRCLLRQLRHWAAAAKRPGSARPGPSHRSCRVRDRAAGDRCVRPGGGWPKVGWPKVGWPRGAWPGVAWPGVACGKRTDPRPRAGGRHRNRRRATGPERGSGSLFRQHARHGPCVQRGTRPDGRDYRAEIHAAYPQCHRLYRGHRRDFHYSCDHWNYLDGYYGVAAELGPERRQPRQQQQLPIAGRHQSGLLSSPRARWPG